MRNNAGVLIVLERRLGHLEACPPRTEGIVLPFVHCPPESRRHPRMLCNTNNALVWLCSAVSSRLVYLALFCSAGEVVLRVNSCC